MTEDDRPVDDGQRRLLATLERLLAIQTLEIEGALDAASTLLAEALGADKVDAFLHDPAIASLVAGGTSDTPLGRLQHQLGLNRLPLANGGRMVTVYQDGAPFRTGRSDKDPVELSGVTGALGVRSTLAAPIDVGGQRRGVLSVVSVQPERFTPDDLHFCEAAARWIGLVAHRAELAERVAREAASQARHLAADELIDVLAHDLRTPLTPARGYLDLLRREVTQAGLSRAVGYVEQIGLALDRVGHMIGALLDAGRLDQGLFALECGPVDLMALARRTVETLQQPARPIALRGPDELVVEKADTERLRQALENLVSNALGHTPEAVPVVVEVIAETRGEGEWAVLSVHDEGPGIPSTLLPTLFDRFVRGTQSRGLGLGLYLARGIAEAHGGTLTVESELGRGTTFWLALPVKGT